MQSDCAKTFQLKTPEGLMHMQAAFYCVVQHLFLNQLLVVPNPPAYRLALGCNQFFGGFLQMGCRIYLGLFNPIKVQ
jgi:hypothetical protein